MVVSIVFSLLILLIRDMRPYAVELGRLSTTNYYHDLASSLTDIQHLREIRILKFGASIHFANRDYFENLILKLLDAEDTHFVIIESSSIYEIDSSGASMLIRVLIQCKERGVTVLFASLHGPIINQLKKTDFAKYVPARYLFVSLHAAVQFAEQVDRAQVEPPSMIKADNFKQFQKSESSHPFETSDQRQEEDDDEENLSQLYARPDLSTGESAEGRSISYHQFEDGLTKGSHHVVN